jgi:hypothetical protein
MALTIADFRLINTECCHVILCWVNPRLPTYCPECGKRIYPQVKSWVTYQDNKARILHKTMD